MKIITNIFILITAILHILFFKLESIDFMKPDVLKRFGLTEESAEFVKVWAFNQGFYNLFLAIGLLYSLYKLKKAKIVEAKSISNFILLTIAGAGIVLYFSAPDKAIAATLQTLPALLGIIFLNITYKKY